MPKKSSAHEKRVDAAVRTLDTTTGLNVPKAMLLAGFSKKDIANKSIRKVIQHRVHAKKATPHRISQALTIDAVDPVADGSVISPLTTSTNALSVATNPKPKRKQIRPTSAAIQQIRIDNLAAKRHKSDAHKAAVRLFHTEKQKPKGMSIRQVHAVITGKYEVCPSIASISRYVKLGLVDASPMKMGPTGCIDATSYKLLCQAYTSLIPINQMNACAGDNSRKKMIPMLAKTFNIGTPEATNLLDRIVRDTSTDIHATKLNCAEDRRIRWTTYQNLDLWFSSWEVFVVEYGFATINQNGQLHFDEEMKMRVLNLDETNMSLDGSNGNRGGRPTATYYDVRFPQLGKATSKSALSTTMISGSTAAGEPLPPHFQFQTAAQSAEGEAIRIECICYMLDVRGTFGHPTEQSFPSCLV